MPNQSFERGIFEQCVPTREKGRGKPSCNQLKAPESIHTIPALQNRRLFCLREMLQKDDFMCKLDIKDAYFSVPLHQSSRKYVRFLW